MQESGEKRERKKQVRKILEERKEIGEREVTIAHID